MSSGGIFDVEGKRERVAELEAAAAKENFWDDSEAAQSALKETSSAKNVVERYDKWSGRVEDAKVLLELAVEAEDEDSAKEVSSHIDEIQQAVDDLEFQRMLSGEDDPCSAVVTVHAGAGGVDAADWAEMLLKMLVRYCQKKGWKVDVVDEQPAEEAGIRSATLMVDGEYAYGLLKAELGVHRLVRISPFDANAKRHTSFAAIDVSPDIDDSIEVDIDESDLRIDVYRASGAGGQHVNKTESAVRITHLPTNIVVQCQNQRSQHKNKASAMKILRSRIYEHLKAAQDAKYAEAAWEKKKIEWGSQIRSYVLAPYQQVADHRTDLKVGNVEAVLNGDLDIFIREFLLQKTKGPDDSADA